MGFFSFVLRTYNLLIEKFRGEKGRLEKMIVIWKPVWYELDQAIVAREIDYYYLSKDGTEFMNGEASTQDQEVIAKAVRITHPELGTMSGILTNGLSYRVFLESGEVIHIDAEENTGQVEYPADFGINEWNFEVELEILEFTGYSSEERITLMTDKELQVYQTAREARHNSMLDI